MEYKKNSCCVSNPGLHPEAAFEGQLCQNTARRLPQSKGSLQMRPSVPSFECTAAILSGLTYPKILCAHEKEERHRENSDIAWRRSFLLRAWVAEIVM